MITPAVREKMRELGRQPLQGEVLWLFKLARNLILQYDCDQEKLRKHESHVCKPETYAATGQPAPWVPGDGQW